MNDVSAELHSTQDTVFRRATRPSLAALVRTGSEDNAGRFLSKELLLQSLDP